ncbi:MAG: HAD-IC family P-type ATPase, partial [Gammaproteobacteria bacterium]
DGDGDGEDDGASRSADAMSAQWQRLAETGVFVNEAELEIEDEQVIGSSGDAVDVAFLVLAEKLGIDRAALADAHPESAARPFASAARYAASVRRGEDGETVHVKGAAEVVVGCCDDVDADDVSAQERALAAEGYRVLALAAGPVGDWDAEREEPPRGLAFRGLVGLIDPVRERVPEAVRQCREAGIRVCMVTGDHPETALAIARDIGFAERDDTAVTGKEIGDGDADDGRARERIAAAPVFARVEPTQKVAIVDALREAGHFVAVTGDGVNDAPALRRAHVGVAMGRAGTDVAREAADLILTDDNFASIVAGVEQGRIAYGNVRKVVWLLLATGVAEVLLLFLALASGLPLPLTAVQLLWLNLVTNGLQDVALAFERGARDVLEVPPRPPDQPIVDRTLGERVLVSGVYFGALAFAVYWYLVEIAGFAIADARNHVLLLMVLFENVHALSCRSETRSAFSVPLADNPLIAAGILGALGVHVVALYLPGLSAVLEVSPLPWTSWLALVPVAASLLAVDETAKALRRRRAR